MEQDEHIVVCFKNTSSIVRKSYWLKVYYKISTMKSKKHIVSDKTIMWFGKYKGFKLIDIPNEYFQYLLDNNISFRGIKNYSKRRLKLKSNSNDNN